MSEFTKKRKAELEAESKKGQEELSKLQIQANHITDVLKRLQGAYAMLSEQEELEARLEQNKAEQGKIIDIEPVTEEPKIFTMEDLAKTTVTTSELAK